MLRRLLAILLLIHVAVICATAQTPTPSPVRTLKVAVYVESPFVEKTSTGYGGFAIDLWDRIAASQGWRSEYQEAKTIPELINLVHTGQVDIAVTDLFITRDRLKQVDFTQPYFDAGLRIMVDQDRHGGLSSIWQGLSQGGHLKIIGCGAMLIVVLAILLTLFERQWDAEFHREWHKGFAESFYHVMSVATTGKTSHKEMFGWVGKLLSAVWLACGVAVVAYITAAVSSVMTANTLNNQINGPGDLGSKAVATITGSLGEQFCRGQMLNTQTFDNIPDAVTALLKNQVQAIVYDAPVLEHYDNAHPELPITEVGPLFLPQKYGFALPQDSPLTRAVSTEILGAKEDGFLTKLKTTYFGNTE